MNSDSGIECYIIPSVKLSERTKSSLENNMKIPVSTVLMLPTLVEQYYNSPWGTQGNRSLDYFFEFLNENEIKFIIP